MGSDSVLEATIYADGAPIHRGTIDATDPNFRAGPDGSPSRGLEALVDAHWQVTSAALDAGAEVRVVIHDPAGDVPDLVIEVRRPRG